MHHSHPALHNHSSQQAISTGSGQETSGRHSRQSSLSAENNGGGSGSDDGSLHSRQQRTGRIHKWKKRLNPAKFFKKSTGNTGNTTNNSELAQQDALARLALATAHSSPAEEQLPIAMEIDSKYPKRPGQQPQKSIPKTVVIHQTPLDAVTAARRASIPLVSPILPSLTSEQHRHSTVAIETAALAPHALPVLLDARNAQSNSTFSASNPSVASIPLHHANTIDLPTLKKVQKARRKNKNNVVSAGTDIYWGYNSGAKKPLAPMNLVAKSEKSTYIHFPLPMRIRNQSSSSQQQTNHQALLHHHPQSTAQVHTPYFTSKYRRPVSSQQQPLPPPNFQQIPLERFGTIEPHHGSFKTSLQYRMHKQHAEQDSMTIHSFDKKGKELLDKLGVSPNFNANAWTIDGRSSYKPVQLQQRGLSSTSLEGITEGQQLMDFSSTGPGTQLPSGTTRLKPPAASAGGDTGSDMTSAMETSDGEAYTSGDGDIEAEMVRQSVHTAPAKMTSQLKNELGDLLSHQNTTGSTGSGGIGLKINKSGSGASLMQLFTPNPSTLSTTTSQPTPSASSSSSATAPGSCIPMKNTSEKSADKSPKIKNKDTQRTSSKSPIRGFLTGSGSSSSVEKSGPSSGRPASPQ